MGVIAISGQAASGKTTVARELARRLNYRFVSAGELFRRVAAQRGVSFLELHKLAEHDYSIDKAIDEESRREAQKGNVVIEGHLAAWIVRDLADVCVYLKADLEVRARRLASRDGKSLEEAIEEIKAREESNRRRYKAIYGIDISDLSIFDLVIDTTYIGVEDVVKFVYDYVMAVLKGKGRV